MDIPQSMPARMGQAEARDTGSVPLVREVVRKVAVIQEVDRDRTARFSGKRRPKMIKTCACGCGRQFSTTFPDKRYLTDAHRKRADRRMSAHVQG